MIAAGDPFRRIATRYSLNDKTVGTHAHAHVKPFIAEVERLAQLAVLETVRAYRDEVRLPIQDKVRMLQDKLLVAWANGDIDVPNLSREWRGTVDLEAKLTGAYIKEATNPVDVSAVASEIADRLVSQGVMSVEEARERVASLYPELVSKAVN